MSERHSALSSETIAWLLEEDNPSVRYFTLRDLLGRPATDPELKATGSQIMEAGIVPAILAKQGAEGAWGDAKKFYTTKYSGTSWQLIILAELGANGADKRIGRACELILNQSQDRESGGFSISAGARTPGGRHSQVIPCLTGNMVWSLIRLGYLEDPRLQKALEWITTYARFDDGEGEPPMGWPYDQFEMCWGKHTCHMGVVKTLKALSAIPLERRSPEARCTIEKAAEYLLAHRIYRRSHDLSRTSKPGWLKFGFPLMYQSDVLEILDVLTDLGYRDERMGEALGVLRAKQDRQGRWKLESTFNGRFLEDIERKGEPSKWITLRALRVLKRYYG